jgi:hypothetical protein
MRKAGVPRQSVPNCPREAVPGVKLFRSAFPSLPVSEVLRENVLRENNCRRRFRRRSHFSIQPGYAALGAVGCVNAAEAAYH